MNEMSDASNGNNVFPILNCHTVRENNIKAQHLSVINIRNHSLTSCKIRNNDRRAATRSVMSAKITENGHSSTFLYRVASRTSWY